MGNTQKGVPTVQTATHAFGVDAATATPPFTFEDLLNAFFAGVEDERLRLNPPLNVDTNKTEITTLLKDIYEPRFDKRRAAGPLPPTTPKCAELLGRIALVMLRSNQTGPDGKPLLEGDDPIDHPDEPALQLRKRHIIQAREMYAHYTNSKQSTPPKNRILGPFPQIAGERDPRETNDPCPICP